MQIDMSWPYIVTYMLWPFIVGAIGSIVFRLTIRDWELHVLLVIMLISMQIVKVVK
jgi:uncharacterized membrane protein YoaK (UPF0700 family)